MKNKTKKVVQRRSVTYASRVVTEIWEEQPSPKNPYLAERCRCRGYDLFDLMEKRSFIDMLYLLLLGDLPTKENARLLETLMIAFINPGPRHPAARAAIYAGCGRTQTTHILPIALSVLSGEHLGGAEVTACMRFLEKHKDAEPKAVAKDLLERWTPPDDGDRRIAPGFGSRFNSIDPLSQKIAKNIEQLAGKGKAFQFGTIFSSLIEPHDMGWLSSGICAAVFLDLGFPPRAGAGLFQFLCAPGLLAHGLELADKPINSVPFLDEDRYIIETQKI